MSCFCSTQEEFYCEVLLLDETKLILTTHHQGIKLSPLRSVVDVISSEHESGNWPRIFFNWKRAVPLLDRVPALALAPGEKVTLQVSSTLKSTRGCAVLDYTFSHVNLLESDYFGLRYCDLSHQTYWLDPTKTLAEHKDLMATGPPYTLYFGVKFYAEDPCKLKEEVTRYQFFLQIKQDVLQGRLPCPFNVSTQMAALAIQSELGDYDPYKHMPGYVSEYRFVPDQQEDLEDAIEQNHKTLMPRITKIFFKETQFELRVLGKDCNETSYFFEAPSKASCKNLWKCCVEHHTFFSGKTAMQMGKDECVGLPRPNLEVVRTRSKTYPKRSIQSTSLNNGSRSVTKAGNSLGEGQAKASTLPPAKSPKVSKTESVSQDQPNKPTAPWNENAPQSGLYNSASERNKSPKFPNTRRRSPSGGSENEVLNSSRQRKGQSSEDPSSKQHRRRSRSRGNTSSGSESENSNREHRKKRNRRSPDVQAKEQLWKHIQTQGDPIRIRHSHSPRSYRQYRRSHCSDGERSVLSEVNSRTDLVPPLPVTRTVDLTGSGTATSQKKDGSKDNLSESSGQETKISVKSVKNPRSARVKTET
ncbi:Band 4.1-like protein 4A [Bagarius yarrelli]|uniref:Band 4.1-like protein 4A n=1 Tax=Bagarius yarrelli TaxID=175774 RepID=A0A556U3D1_BAGYA|nr:Band 4.1-like protein 4A [Bagarius yarrelli]